MKSPLLAHLFRHFVLPRCEVKVPLPFVLVVPNTLLTCRQQLLQTGSNLSEKNGFISQIEFIENMQTTELAIS